MTHIDFAQNWEDCAQFWAAHIGKPFGKNVYFDINILAMYRGIYAETLDTIETDPQTFAERVNDYLYAQSNVNLEAL